MAKQNLQIVYTVRMKSLTISSGEMHLHPNYKSDFAHFLAFQKLIIEF